MPHATTAKTGPTADEITTADAQLIAALRPINRRRRVPLGRVRSFWPTADYSSPTLSAEVVFDPSALAPAYSDGKRIILGKDAFRYLDSTRRLGRAFAAACGRLDQSAGGKQRTDDTVPIRYAATATQPISIGQGGGAGGATVGHRVGETKTENGVTYRLNENHRWVVADASAAAAGNAAGTPGNASPGGSTPAGPAASSAMADTLDAPTPPRIDQAQTIDASGNIGQDGGQAGPDGQPKPGERWKGGPAGGAGQQQFPIDSTTHQQRHKFVSSQLGKVQGEARRMMAAMMATPEYKQGGEVATKDFSQEQAKSLYDWMKSNVGQESSDGSKVVDLQNGRLGFSTPAGAIAVWPPDQNGRQKVGFTNKTGVVGRAMGLGGAAGVQTAVPPGQQPPPAAAGAGAELSPEAAPGNPLEPERPTAVPQSGQPQQPAMPAAPANQPQNQQATPNAASATPNVADNSTPSIPSPGGTSGAGLPHEAARQSANEARANLDDAISTWERASQMGLDPKGHARWRSYVSALKRHWSEKDQFAGKLEREHGRTTEKAGKQEKQQAREKEMLARKAEIDAERQARREKMTARETERETSRQKKAEESAAAKAAKAAAAEEKAKAKQSGQGGKSGDPADPMQDEVNRAVAEDPDMTLESLQSKFGVPHDRARAMLRAAGGNKAGQYPVKPEPSTPLLDKPAGEGGTGNVPSATPETLERMKLPKGQQKLHALADKYLDHFGVNKSDQNRQFLSKHIKGGRLKNPKDLRTVLRTAKKLHERGDVTKDDHESLRESLRRKVNREGRESWKAVRNKQAEMWGMEPSQYEEFARDIWDQHVEQHGAREAAKKAARKMTGLSAKDINLLENKGFDSGSDHPRLKNFDTAASSIASEHKGLGWGGGADDEGEEADYSQKLWELMKEGSRPIPGRSSPEFTAKVDEYLQSLQSSAGRSSSSSAAGGDPADGPPEDEDSTPFSKRRNAFLQRYAGKQPTESQKDAGNYKMRKIRLHGMDVSIENDKGTRRRPEWPVMSADYGYIRRTEGADGDHVDVFVGPTPESEIVYVVDQVDKSGDFDEHKCMIGWINEADASAAYLKNYTKDWKLGPVSAMTIGQFKEWLENGDTTKPVAEQELVKA